MLRIQKLHMNNIGCFADITMEFKPGVNIICGENGIGKTTTLEAIGSIFSGGFPPGVYRRAASDEGGRIDCWITSMGREHKSLERDEKVVRNINRGLPNEQEKGSSPIQPERASELIHIKAGRDLPYESVVNISKDTEKNESTFAAESSTGLNNHDLKNWLANRYLFSRAGNSLTDIQNQNHDFVIQSFSILDEGVSFHSLVASTYDLMVQTPDGIIPYEMLSSGFRTTLFTILGIVKELELRKYKAVATAFSGVVLIDEIDVHLHPLWQKRILGILADVFPQTQFIVTTHSPHVVQTADPAQLLPLRRDSADRSIVSSIQTNSFGFQGWTLEEILTDAMGLTSTHSDLYKETLEEFGNAIDKNDESTVLDKLEKLELMLHPSSHLRKLYRLQAAPFTKAQK